MNYIGQGLAFAALVAGATALEINGKAAGGLWVLVVLWAILTDWAPRKEGSRQ